LITILFYRFLNLSFGAENQHAPKILKNLEYRSRSIKVVQSPVKL
jgi:hypothetical protein